MIYAIAAVTALLALDRIVMAVKEYRRGRRQRELEQLYRKQIAESEKNKL